MSYIVLFCHSPYLGSPHFSFKGQLGLNLRCHAGRKVVADIVDKSGGYVDARTLTRALSEDTEAGQPSLQDRQALVVSMRRAYGSGSLRQLDKLLARAKRIDPQDANYQAQIEELMTRIHPPKTDEKGAIVQQGYIDTEGE